MELFMTRCRYYVSQLAQQAVDHVEYIEHYNYSSSSEPQTGLCL